MDKRDIWDADMFCKECNKKAVKGVEEIDGFRLRVWECPVCGQKWYHPLDANRMLHWNKLKNQEFKVTLRMVGNSYVTSIPKEIVQFEEFRRGEKAIWHLESPDKLVLVPEESRLSKNSAEQDSHDR